MEKDTRYEEAKELEKVVKNYFDRLAMIDRMIKEAKKEVGESNE